MASHIRGARSSDAEFLAWVVLSASRAHMARGMWDLIIGADEAGCLEYLRRLTVAEPRSLYHYGSFLVAEVDGVPAAALCGFLANDAWSLVGDAMAKVQRDLHWNEAQAAASYQRVAPIWASCMPANIGADFAIENVATMPEYRRRGLVQALIGEVLRSARSSGSKLAQISTYIGNHSAISAYEKAGFRVRDAKRCAAIEESLGAPGFVRLILDLND